MLACLLLPRYTQNIAPAASLWPLPSQTLPFEHISRTSLPAAFAVAHLADHLLCSSQDSVHSRPPACGGAGGGTDGSSDAGRAVQESTR
jgi:hypothetical protein